MTLRIPIGDVDKDAYKSMYVNARRLQGVAKDNLKAVTQGLIEAKATLRRGKTVRMREDAMEWIFENMEREE
jgi:hypothetical protein